MGNGQSSTSSTQQPKPVITRPLPKEEVSQKVGKAIMERNKQDAESRLRYGVSKIKYVITGLREYGYKILLG